MKIFCNNSRFTILSRRAPPEKTQSTTLGSGVGVKNLKSAIRQGGVNLKNSGFTLIEVVVAMILVSMITLIMAFALRINLQAWERGVDEGDKVQIEVVLPHMLERELRSTVSSTSFPNSIQTGSGTTLLRASSNSLSDTASLSQPGAEIQLQFIGREQFLSFYTLYSPQGTPSQGLIRVAYIYDQKAKELTVYEKMVNSEEDIKASEGLFSTSGKPGSKKSAGKSSVNSGRPGKKSGADKLGRDTLAVATITDVENFSLSFLAAEDSAVSDQQYQTSSQVSSSRPSSSRKPSDSKIGGASFQDTWDEKSSDPPGFIRLSFAQTKRRGGTPSVWLFRVGGKI